ncbi:MAG: glycosyltransferase family 2 protein [Patescibacteria group bacterium]|jgi:glycosyltransferase involved in cell wall biosynthesis|nr:glycosyltransferase family 2 protein [Patescibacteria group bacterium]
MAKELKFSIILANYNNAAFISEAIESVLEQTFVHWELVIIDDCSFDDSFSVIEKYLNDDRITFFKNTSNVGYAASLKRGVELSSGDVVVILDSDDALINSSLEELDKAYKKNKNIGFVYSTCYNCDEHLNIVEINPWIGEIKDGSTNLHEIKVGHIKSFKKDAYYKTAGFDIKQKKSVDRDIIYKLEEVTGFYFINKPLYKYRIHTGGISQKKNAVEAKLYNLRNKLNSFKRRKKNNLSKKEITSILIDILPYYLKKRNWGKFKYYLTEIFKIYPYNFKAWLIFLFRIVKFPFAKIFKKIWI